MTISVVTGAARGIGRAFARALADEGGTIVLADLDTEEAERVAREVHDVGAEAIVERCDVTREGDMHALAQRWSNADLVVANAGVLVVGEAHQTDASALRHAIEVNLFGVVHTCQAFVPAMIARGRGTVLNVASLAGLVPAPLMGCYAASKAAVISYSDALRAELAPTGVQVTVLCPSFTRTDLVNRAHARDPGARDFGQRVMDRIGARPEDVVRMGLAAAARGRPYAVPTMHARLAWRLRGLAPNQATHLASAVYRFYRRTRDQEQERSAVDVATRHSSSRISVNSSP